jgi:hypothetical protein
MLSNIKWDKFNKNIYILNTIVHYQNAIYRVEKLRYQTLFKSQFLSAVVSVTTI